MARKRRFDEIDKAMNELCNSMASPGMAPQSKNRRVPSKGAGEKIGTLREEQRKTRKVLLSLLNVYLRSLEDDRQW